MINKLALLALIAAAIVLSFTACAENDNEEPSDNVQIEHDYPVNYVPGHLMVGFTGHTVEQAEDLVEKYNLSLWFPLVSHCIGTFVSGNLNEIVEYIEANEIVHFVHEGENNTICVWFNSNARKESAESLLATIDDVIFEPIVYSNSCGVLVPEGEEEKWIDILKTEPIIKDVRWIAHSLPETN